MGLRSYKTDKIIVTFDPTRCIHSARCLMGLPQVFDNAIRPWVQPEHATPDKVAETVRTCPSGALHYERLDGGPAEAPDEPPSVEPVRGGPLYIRGNVEIQDSAGETISKETRVALCRCGHSQKKPICDNTHRIIGFRT